MDELAPRAAHHALTLQVVEQHDERRPETTHVVENDGLVVIAQRDTRADGEQLVERAHAARQHDERIAHVHHQLLAVGQVLRGDVHVKEGCQASHLFYLARNDAYHAASGVLTGPADGMHQTGIVTAKDYVMPLAGTPGAKLAGLLEIFGRYLVVGRTKHTNLHIMSLS